MERRNLGEHPHISGCTALSYPSSLKASELIPAKSPNLSLKPAPGKHPNRSPQSSQRSPTRICPEAMQNCGEIGYPLYSAPPRALDHTFKFIPNKNMCCSTIAYSLDIYKFLVFDEHIEKWVSKLCIQWIGWITHTMQHLFIQTIHWIQDVPL